jgi:transcriptional regulator with XRE-family HTH domain
MAKQKKPVELPQRPRRKLDKAERQFVAEVAAALVKMRKTSGLSQKELARMTGSTAPHVERAERGVPSLPTPDFDRLRRWSKAMGWQMTIVFMEPAPGEKWIQFARSSPKSST